MNDSQPRKRVKKNQIDDDDEPVIDLKKVDKTAKNNLLESDPKKSSDEYFEKFAKKDTKKRKCTLTSVSWLILRMMFLVTKKAGKKESTPKKEPQKKAQQPKKKGRLRRAVQSSDEDFEPDEEKEMEDCVSDSLDLNDVGKQTINNYIIWHGDHKGFIIL